MNPFNRAMARRRFLNLAGTGGILAVTGGALWSLYPQQAAAQSLSPDAALKRLIAGNQRFVQQKSIHPHQLRDRLKEVAQTQHPYVALLSCADSRVPPEILFDEGIGDVFDIRVAGNIVTPEVLGSLEYAVEMLNTPLVMVLGHERCGAVTAAVQAEPLPGSIGSLVKAIKPAIDKLDRTSADLVDRAVVANVQYQIETLKRKSPLLSQRLLQGKLSLVGGRYDLDSGEVALV